MPIASNRPKSSKTEPAKARSSKAEGPASTASKKTDKSRPAKAASGKALGDKKAAASAKTAPAKSTKTAATRPGAAKNDKSFGGSRTATGQTAVSSKENPNPARSATGNTRRTRPDPAAVKADAKPADKSALKAARSKPGDAPGASAQAPNKKPPPDHSDATGRDHPSQSEHMHRLYERLHGASDQRINAPGQTIPGRKKQGGFDHQQFQAHQRAFKNANLNRRTQGRG